MKKLVYAINLSIDGGYDHTKFYPDEDVMEYFTQLTLDSDTFVYGRKTYQLMVPFWPDLAKNPGDDRKVDRDFALAYETVRKIVVFSKSLDSPEDGRTTVYNSDLQDEILKLKQGEGKNILVGGVDIPSQLMELGLIDEYYFLVHPIILGEGNWLFKNVHLQDRYKLKLADSKSFQSGVMALHYVK